MIERFGFEDDDGTGLLQQGSVIRWYDRFFQSPWQTYGVIVTADCDLAHNKHRGRISYIPAHTSKDFFWYSWVPHLFTSRLQLSLRTATARVNKWLIKSGRVTEEIDHETFYDWLKFSGPEAILNDMGVSDQGEKNGLLNIIIPPHHIHQLLLDDEKDMDLFFQCYEYIDTRIREDRSLAQVAFQKFVQSIPGDVFHLPCSNSNLDDNLFLMMRDINQCDVGVVALSPDELRFGEAKAQIIGRISAPYRYAMTQSLARIFADIGLPESFNDKRKQASARFFDEVKK